MDKKLYMVSLGPGASELITLKALKVLQESEIICVPTKSSDGSFTHSLTYKIVTSLMEEYDFSKKIVPVYTPMHFKEEDWHYQVDVILNCFNTANTISFVTLGDASVYSTVYYLLDIIKIRDFKVYQQSEVIPGITSFSQASAKVKKPLCIGDSSFSIVPLLEKEVPNTTVYMRPKIGMSTEHIEEKGDIYTFENLNFLGEKISSQKIVKTSKYMTLFIDFFTKGKENG